MKKTSTGKAVNILLKAKASRSPKRYSTPTIVKKKLAGEADLPSATVVFDFSTNRKFVEVFLEGTILGEHVTPLRDFLIDVSSFPGNHWTLQLEDLEVISLRGLRVLVKFAQALRQRGFEVKITSIRAAVLATMLELNLCEYFAWPNHQKQLQPIEEKSKQEEARRHEITTQPH